MCIYIDRIDRQLGDNSVYERIEGDAISPLIDKICHHLLKVRLNGDIDKESMNYFEMDNPRLGRFYLLPKIHKRLYGVPGRPVISNCGYYTEDISSFIDHHLQPLVSKIKTL